MIRRYTAAALIAVSALVGCAASNKVAQQVPERDVPANDPGARVVPTFATHTGPLLPTIDSGTYDDLGCADERVGNVPMEARNLACDSRVAEASLQTKIVRPTKVMDGTFGFAVALTRLDAARRPEVFCSGVLVAPAHVLTAGHCICDAKDKGFADRILVVHGGVPADSALDRRFLVADIKPALANCTNLKAGLDLAVLRLTRSMTTLANRMVLMDMQPSAITQGRIFGYGATDPSGTAGFGWKQQALVTVVSQACGGKVRLTDGRSVHDAAHYGCKAGNEMVAQNIGGSDSCKGDSGGPLIVTRNRGDGGSGDGLADRYVLAGITSRGIDKAFPVCGAGGIYERITPAAREWIETAIGEGS